LEFRSISVWRKQIDFIYELHGLITITVHPDYTLSEERVGYFRELLEYLVAKDRLWMTTATQIADWVRGQAVVNSERQDSSAQSSNPSCDRQP
jgi:type II secretory pathway component PulK